jgi:glc operon protein GlcG
MDLSLAQQVLAAAVARAEEIGVRLSFSIVDAEGHEILTARMDGAPWFTPHIARTKARTCVAMGMDSRDVADLDAAHPGLLKVIEEQVGHTVTVLGGGIVVTDATGAVLGAVAGSGAHPDQDAEGARAGAATWLASRTG